MSTEDNSRVKEKCPIEEQGRNEECPFGAEEEEEEEFKGDEFSIGTERSVEHLS